jgi:hypothetical protein
MKKNGTSTALLAPDGRGWRVRIAGGEDQAWATLDEAIAKVPAGSRVELALPCHSVLLERHKFPATDRAELADMLQLQLEKTLPFSVDEVSHDFQVLGQEENESTVLSVAASHAELDQLCAPLRSLGRLPERITLNALRLAASCPQEEVVLAVWPEQEQLVVAIVCEGKLSWAQVIPSVEADVVLAELPGMLITAELEGVNTNFTTLRISPECSHLEPSLELQFRKPVLPLVDLADAKPELDLLPASWQDEARRRGRNEKLKQNLLLAAVVYLLLVAGAFGYLAWTKNQARKLQLEHAKMEPKYRDIQRQEERWKLIGGAVNPSRYAVEVLHQLTKARVGNENVQFTGFTYTPREWILKGEGTTDAHFEFSQQLKKNADLLDHFELQYPNPTNIKDDRASFTITGKPR